jgi:gliding motility-associated-like protein
MMCHTVSDTVYIEVIEAYSLDVPTAFTPDGDGINDIVYVRGWGLLSLIEFNIYNRWGELIYSSDDINEGWDGTFKGTAQNMDTYAYTVKALTIDQRVMTKNGLINLLR